MKRTLRLAAFAGVVGLLLGSPVAAGAGGGPPGTRKVPDSIDATGGTDVTAELQGFLEQVPNGSTIEFPKDAQYRIEGSLSLVERENLTIDGNGATVFATTTGERTRSQWNVVGGRRIVFRDLVVKGANPNGGTGDTAYNAELEAQHGFNIVGATGVELDHVTVSDVYGDFAYVGQRRGGEWSRKVWVHDSTFTRNGRQGISVVAGRDIVLERNTIGDTRRATFDLEPNSTKGGAKNVFILDNTVGDGRLLFLASHGSGPVDDVTVSGNRLSDRVMSISVVAPPNQRRKGFWIVDNDASNSTSRAPIGFANVDDVVVRGNTQPVSQAGAAGVGLRNVGGATVVDNAFGTGVNQFAVGGTECGRAAASDAEPEPPAIRGRKPGSRVRLPATGATSTTTSVPGSTTAPTAVLDPPSTAAHGSRRGGDDGIDPAVFVIGGAAALAIGGVVTAIVARSRRSRSRRYYRSYD